MDEFDASRGGDVSKPGLRRFNRGRAWGGGGLIRGCGLRAIRRLLPEEEKRGGAQANQEDERAGGPPKGPAKGGVVEVFFVFMGAGFFGSPPPFLLRGVNSG